MAKDESTQLGKRGETSELWSDFDRIFDDMQRRFYDVFGITPFGASSPPVGGGAGFRAAPTDIVDTGSAYRITAEIPGIPKEKLDVRIRGSSVEIRAEQEDRSEKESDGYLHRERSYQGFYRAFELPEPVVGDKANARLDNGLLELELPKQNPTPQPTEVRVKIA